MNDNECLKWCVNRYLNTSDCNPAISTKADKDFAEKTDFKGIKFPVKIRDIQIFKKKKNFIGISVFGYENKEKHPTYVSKKCCEEKHVDLLKLHIKDCFQINNKRIIIMYKKGEYVRFKINERKLKSPFMTYADFESILVPEDDGEHNPEESYTNNYQKHTACSYGYKLV